jgi:hypothetical protein
VNRVPTTAALAFMFSTDFWLTSATSTSCRDELTLWVFGPSDRVAAHRGRPDHEHATGYLFRHIGGSWQAAWCRAGQPPAISATLFILLAWPSSRRCGCGWAVTTRPGRRALSALLGYVTSFAVMALLAAGCCGAAACRLYGTPSGTHEAAGYSRRPHNGSAC